MDQDLVIKTLADFGEVFECIPPYQQKELFRLVIHKAVISEESLELALYSKPPQLSEMTQGAARSGTSNWLPVQDVTRTRLSCLTEREATAVQRFAQLVA